MFRPALTLLLLAALSFGAGLGRQAITDSDEAYYAEAAREMVERGDWLTPHWNYRYRWEKPILYYWLTAATYLIAGPTEWAARLWSALSGVGLALLTWRAGRRLAGRDDVGWLAGAIVATSFGYFTLARLALPDLPLAFCITAAIWAGLRALESDRASWWACAGFAAGLGFLLKGPVAPVIVTLVLLPIWWYERAIRHPSARGLTIAALVFAGVGLPWYAVMWREHGSPYLQSFFVADNLERFATERFNERRWPGYYIPILLGGVMPWTAFLVALAIRPLAALRRRRLAPTPEERRLLLWTLLPLLFFTISTGQQPRYILPILPPLAILLARGMALRLDGAGEPGGPGPGFLCAAWMTVALFAGLVAALVRAQPILVSAGAPTLAIAALGVATVLLARTAYRRRWRRWPGTLALAASVMLLAIQFGALAGVRPEPVEEMAALVRQHRAGDEPVGGYGAFVRNLIFYTRLPQAELYSEDRALSFLSSGDRVLLVASAGAVAELESRLGSPLRRLGAVRYLDTNTIRIRTIVLPDADRDVETVLLVSNR